MAQAVSSVGTTENPALSPATVACCPQLEPCEVCDVLNFDYRLPFRPLVAAGDQHRIYLGIAQHLDLRTREEIGVAGDDRSLLRHLLLADANGAALLGALEVVLLEPRLVVGRRANRGS